jgi:hypothetical protein
MVNIKLELHQHELQKLINILETNPTQETMQILQQIQEQMELIGENK